MLIFATLISLGLANSVFQGDYTGFWEQEIFGGHSIVHWINDGLMAIFFLLIGLELEREIYSGELSSLKNASLPIFGAIGGMLVPALIYLLFNFGLPTQDGIGIPMATDIAFAVGILSLLGRRVPTSLKAFLIALAVIDDLGAIIIIALFYSSGVVWFNLIISLGIFGLLLILRGLKVYSLIPYLIGGIVMWYFMLHSGVHATIAGVLLAFAIPYGDGGEDTPSYKLQHILHKPVAFFILPVFALANTAIVFDSAWFESLGHESSLGIIFGLAVGKPLGIWLLSFLGVALGLGTLPGDLKWRNILGAGCLGGIGFTMSIFITLLAFKGQGLLIDHSKIAILVASVISGIIGYLFLRSSFSKEKGVSE